MSKRNIRLLARMAAALVMLMIALTACSSETKVPNHTEDFYVNDYANVLNQDTYRTMFNLSRTLDEQTGAQIVVVTVDTTNGTEPSTYATTIGRTWGVGDSEKNNGVVILLAVKDREIFVAIGNGLEGVLPDGKTGRLIREYAKPYYSENQFSIGTYELYKAVYSVVANEYGLQPLGGYEEALEPVEETSLSIPITLLILLIFGIFALSIFDGGGGSGGGGYSDWSSGGDYGGGGFSGGGGDFSGGGAGSSF